jgi:Omp85 superfamily domain
LAAALLPPIEGGQLWAQAATSDSKGSHKVSLGAPYPSTDVIPASPVVPEVASGGSGTSPGKSGDKDTPEADGKDRSGSFIFAPIPISNQAIHFGLVPVVQYIFHPNRNDMVSPPSMLAAVGMVATRGTWAAGGGGQLYLHQDMYRVTAFGGHGSVGYDIFGVGQAGGDAGKAYPIRQGGTLALGEVLFRVVDHLYIGPRINYRNLSANSDNGSQELPEGVNPEDLGVQFSELGGGLKVEHDTRDDVFYPTTGHTMELLGDVFHSTREASLLLPENKLNFQNYKPSYNHYLPLTKKQMLAFRGMMCMVAGSPPFFELCQFGAMSDIRGYQPGRYRDRDMFAAQAEYRAILSKRWGYTAFAGVGEVAHTFGEFNFENLLPGGGAGIRFNLDKKRRVNLRGDLAYGKNGFAWNFAVGEAF